MAVEKALPRHQTLAGAYPAPSAGDRDLQGGADSPLEPPVSRRKTSTRMCRCSGPGWGWIRWTHSKSCCASSIASASRFPTRTSPCGAPSTPGGFHHRQQDAQGGWQRENVVTQREAGRCGCNIRERYGAEIVLPSGRTTGEYSAVRDAVGLTDFSFVRSFRCRGQGVGFPGCAARRQRAQDSVWARVAHDDARPGRLARG